MVCGLCLDLFAFVFGVIGRLCSVIVALPGHFLFYSILVVFFLSLRYGPSYSHTAHYCIRLTISCLIG